MKTPHINPTGKIAKTVLMPGDPLRAKYIAETFLDNVEQFNDVRGMLGYTGTYQGKEVSVMGSGMGMPSIGIYSYELFKFYDVENIIRVGSAGAYTKDLRLFDVVLVDECFSESSFALVQKNDDSTIMKASEKLNSELEKNAEKLGIDLIKGRIHSSDVFYSENKNKASDYYDKHGCLCVEMESFALFSNAQVLNKQAACLLTISDSLVTEEATTAEQRQTAFNDMIKIALEMVV
ncbi:purine-nucleoside phosphorylase [Erysipelotrichaceae bacterium OttesenSCG-928-M19]|nr:purine-nucleoside phosphorylase [Erysipelotrichaceae bacterium OttesenSCG-928-M19]